VVKKSPHILPEGVIKARLSSPARNDASRISWDPFLSVSGIRCRRKVFKSKDSTINCSCVDMIGLGSCPSDADVKTQSSNTSSCRRRLSTIDFQHLIPILGSPTLQQHPERTLLSLSNDDVATSCPTPLGVDLIRVKNASPRQAKFVRLSCCRP
jgi:hypothetical protein